MAEHQNTFRLSAIARKLNVGTQTLMKELKDMGQDTGAGPNTLISNDVVKVLEKKYASSMAEKQEAEHMSIGSKVGNTVIQTTSKQEETAAKPEPEKNLKKETAPVKSQEPEVFSGLPTYNVIGKIDLDASKPGKKAEHAAPAQPKEPKAESAPKVEAEPKVEHPQAEKPQAEKPQVEKSKAEKPQAPAPQQQPAPAPAPVEKAKPSAPRSEDKQTSPITPSPSQEETRITTPKPEAAAATVPPASAPKQEESTGNVQQNEEQLIEAKADSLPGLKVIGKIELPLERGRGGQGGKKAKPIASSDDRNKDKRKRKRIGDDDRPAASGQGGQHHNNNGGQRRGPGQGQGQGQGQAGGQSAPKPEYRSSGRPDRPAGPGQQQQQSSTGPRPGFKKDANKKPAGKRGGRDEVSASDVKQGIKNTMARMGAKQGKTRGKYKQQGRRDRQEANEARMQREMAEAAILKVTEFITTAELATLMDVGVGEVIAKAMKLGMFISINQRLDEDTIAMLADEFGFEVKFQSAEEETQISLHDQEDSAEDLEHRAPVVTIMGHVDHGKTSLLDFIRNSNVVSGEAGGITQHIGAYDVVTESGQRIAFLDTPGHEAFTAMRARGAKLTDVAIIVIAADDSIMPQTIEAINHAQVAGVPLVFALNKIDKPAANSNKIKEQLANMNILVEDWGGKYQCYEISAKKGIGITELLDGVLLEAEVLDLKANPNRLATGTIVEASLDKGRGYVATVLVQNGTLRIGDMMLAGQYYGKVKAMLDHRGNRLKEVGPSTPVQVLGLNGAPQAGDRLNVLADEREAKDLAVKREQIMREQSIRATKRVGLSDLSKRLQQGSFHQLNVIIKGDVDGSVEALSDSLLKLSTDEVEVRIIHKAVGAISESDILLAAADAENPTMVIGFQVRPTANARRLAERDGVEIRHYSIIYDAIDEVKLAMEGLLSPEIQETIVGQIEVREVFKISKVGTIAGCFVTEGHVKRSSKIRLIRDGIVVYGGNEKGGEIAALKRYKDDAAEVKAGMECGISIANFNDIRQGDIIEVFEQKEVRRKLD